MLDGLGTTLQSTGLCLRVWEANGLLLSWFRMAGFRKLDLRIQSPLVIIDLGFIDIHVQYQYQRLSTSENSLRCSLVVSIHIHTWFNG